MNLVSGILLYRLRSKAKSFGATDLQYSDRKNKKYYVVYRGNKIHFGDSRYEDFLIHKDKNRRNNYRKRSGARSTINDKTSPDYWSYHLLW